MSVGSLNLARRPFANSRPVARVAVLLWMLSGLLLLFNVILYWSYFAGTGHQRAQLAAQEDQITAENAKVAHLEDEVSGLDLASLNEKVIFLNEKIDQRTFSWSLLFDRVAAVLPRDVRLTRLSPTGLVEQGSNGRRVARRSLGPTDRVALTIGGEARSDEPLLQFVDNLFAYPALDEPALSREGKNDDGTLTFDLKVGYRPGGLPADAPTGSPAVTPAAGGGAAMAPTAGGTATPELRELSPPAGTAEGTGFRGMPGRRPPARGGAVGAGAPAAPAGAPAGRPGSLQSFPAGGRPSPGAGSAPGAAAAGSTVGTVVGSIGRFQAAPRAGAVPQQPGTLAPPQKTTPAGPQVGPRGGPTTRPPAMPARPALPGTSRPAASSTARLAGGGLR